MPQMLVDTLDRSPAATIASSRIGWGQCHAHHGEILQGAFRDRDGRVLPGLVTLPCYALRSRAAFLPDDTGELRSVPSERKKALAAARLTLEGLGLAGQGGTLRLESNIPVGAGLGSSTADVVATIRSVLDAFDGQMEPSEIARLAVASERASDSTMFPHGVVLFGQRSGIILERLAGSLPPMHAVGVDTAPGVQVDTLSIKPRVWTEHEVESYEFLRAQLRRALKTADVRLLGHVATQSALINRSALETPRLHDLAAIGREAGAVGVQIAHSGTVAALLFDAADCASEHRVQMAKRLLLEAGMTLGLSFSL